MIHFKEGVVAKDIKLPLMEGLIIAALVYQDLGYGLVVTSLGDGEHKPGSLHYRGYAADLRTRHVRVGDVPHLVRELGVSLGRDYQVIFEGDHLHLEYDPKRDGGASLP